VRDVLTMLLMGCMFVGCLDAAADAAVSQQESHRAEARALRAEAAAVRAELAAGDAEWASFQALRRQDAVCDCTYNLTEDPLANHLRHAAALYCKRCVIKTHMTEDVPHDGEPL